MGDALFAPGFVQLQLDPADPPIGPTDGFEKCAKKVLRVPTDAFGNQCCRGANDHGSAGPQSRRSGADTEKLLDPQRRLRLLEKQRQPFEPLDH